MGCRNSQPNYCILGVPGRSCPAMHTSDTTKVCVHLHTKSTSGCSGESIHSCFLLVAQPFSLVVLLMKVAADSLYWCTQTCVATL